MLAAGVVHGQETELRASYKQRYERQVRNVGVVGVGVETILDRWEKDCRTIEMFKSKFDFNYAKSLSSEVVQNPSSRFLGEKPVLTLKVLPGRMCIIIRSMCSTTSIFRLRFRALAGRPS